MEYYRLNEWKPMDLIEYLAKKKGISLSKLGQMAGESQNQIYARKNAKDIKFEVFQQYLDLLDAEIWIQDLDSPDEWRIKRK